MNIQKVVKILYNKILLLYRMLHHIFFKKDFKEILSFLFIRNFLKFIFSKSYE